MFLDFDDKKLDAINFVVESLPLKTVSVEKEEMRMRQRSLCIMDQEPSHRVKKMCMWQTPVLRILAVRLRVMRLI